MANYLTDLRPPLSFSVANLGLCSYSFIINLNCKTLVASKDAMVRLVERELETKSQVSKSKDVVHCLSTQDFIAH